jgi:hypothetical protein
VFSSDLREKLSHWFCVKKCVNGTPIYAAKEPILTFNIDEHVVGQFVIADAPDHSAPWDLDALQRVKFDCAKAFQLDNLTARLASCEQPNENNHTHAVVETPSLLSISCNFSGQAGYPVRSHFLFDAVTYNLLTFRGRPLLAFCHNGLWVGRTSAQHQQ